MRPIDADALLDVVGKILVPYNAAYAAYQIKTAIDSAPTIDAVPVVHGRWIEAHAWVPDVFICSICGEKTTDTSFGVPRANYCPNCGSRMDLEGEE